ALGLALGSGVGAGNHLEHDFGSDLAGVGQSDLAGVADVIPAHAIAQGIDEVPRLATGGLHTDGEATLVRVPDLIGRGLGLEIADVEFAEFVLAGRHWERPFSTLSWPVS